MQQANSQHGVNQKENSCTLPEKEPSALWQKQNSESGNHASHLDEVSPATKREPYDFPQRQSCEEERTMSCKNEEDMALLMQKPVSNPKFPAQESKQPLVSHLMRDERTLEKLQPRRNLDAGIHRSPSDQGSFPHGIPQDFSKIPKDEPDNLHLRQSPDSGVQTSEKCEEKNSSLKREMASDILLPAQSLQGVPASQSEKQELTSSTRAEKAVEKLQPRRNPETGVCNSQSDQVGVPSSISKKLSIIPKEEREPNNLQPRQCLDARNHAVVSKEEKCTHMKMEKVSQNLVQMSSVSIGVAVPQYDQEKFAYSTKSEKVEKLQPRRNTDPVVQGLQSDAESTPSKVLEKGSDDGYNWRKYGQKLIKGNEFIRSYYKCTYPNCQAKKQVEKSHDGCKTDINYIGQHHHQKPQHSPQVTSASQVRVPETPTVPASKTPTETSGQSTLARTADGVASSTPCSNNGSNDKDDHPDSKRQKREITSADDNGLNRPNSESRLVVQTLSEVDIVNDGYRWRKYGQKLVKGNPNPRSYYRCSNAGCPVKKHVERASHDSKVVITTYEGQHDHDMPPSRTVTQSIARDNASMMTTNGESRSKPEENNPVPLEMVVHVSATEQEILNAGLPVVSSVKLLVWDISLIIISMILLCYLLVLSLSLYLGAVRFFYLESRYWKHWFKLIKSLQGVE
ncbi:WRKY transcription factor WRKY24 [Sesamum alatum]|uniref:WRKY transcription factor WRKY24 n=1 Tax=Sesamum alatum TaxID=300844 RepID=A0AAE1YWG2_9LAMI|nr:WRKY transcription factor WRKY24 [Sesamum alatum]